MFRLIYLRLKTHPQLGDLELNFLEQSELNQKKRPYTSVIIGPNGTGKSFILRTLSEIFRQFKSYQETDEIDFHLPFFFHLRYKIDENTFDFVTGKWAAVSAFGGETRGYHFLKNRPENEPIFHDKQWEFKFESPYEVPIDKIAFPDRLLVNSVMLNDRFIFYNSNPSDFYQYLGIRSSSNRTSTKASARRTILNLFNAKSSNQEFIKNLKELLEFLGFKRTFKIEYKTKINSLFFSGKLKKADFIKYFEYWWDPNFTYSKRKKNNPIWSIPYYKDHFKQNDALINYTVKFLNNIVKDSNRLIHKEHSKSKLIEIDLFNEESTSRFLQTINHLENLDIINLDGIRLLKENSTLSVDEISSGEYHMLISLIGIFSKIRNNSLILIDEPEISLHPNWQMRYVSFMKRIFRNFSSSHFILTTHSHFLISDLEGSSSSVISLSRADDNTLNADLLMGKDTYGWSAEDVLYRVFNVKTTSNYYLEIDLRTALSIINKNSKEFDKLDSIINRLDKLELNQADPTNEIIKQIKQYRNKR